MKRKLKRGPANRTERRSNPHPSRRQRIPLDTLKKDLIGEVLRQLREDEERDADDDPEYADDEDEVDLDDGDDEEDESPRRSLRDRRFGASQTRRMQQILDRADRRSGGDKDDEAKKGIAVARMVRALLICGGDADKAVRLARRHWGPEDIAVKALLASDLETGGVLVAPEFSSELIEVLRPGSVLRSLNPRIWPMNRGTMTAPKHTRATQASYIGEVSVIPATDIGTGQLQLVAKKLAALVPISNDLLRWGSAADTLIRDDLALSLNERGDLAFVRGNGAQLTPRGLRFWATATQLIADPANTTTPTLAQILTLVGLLRLRLRQANIKMVRPGWIMSPRTEQVLRDTKNGFGAFVFRPDMNAGRFEQFPYRVTTQIPENLGSGSDETEIYLCDFNEAVIGESETLIIDASNTASYVDASSTMQSSFSRDQSVIRAIMEHDFGMLHDEGVSVATAVRWTTAP